MAYAIEFRPAARKAIDRLEESVFNRISPRIDALTDNPRPMGSVKLAGHPSLFRIRIGDWRVVYALNDQRRPITVTIVAHRRESYRGL
jgi:mRNA interferase RelE/StbE